MKEYIERDVVLKHLDECRGTPPEICYSYPIFTALKCFVEDIPAADVVEVRHGKWVCLEAEIGFFACSECDHTILRAKCNYCPNCGAKMDKEA